MRDYLIFRKGTDYFENADAALGSVVAENSFIAELIGVARYGDDIYVIAATDIDCEII